ncbi:MAG: DUF4342 domain-containing protein [Clostridia bacterium]|nr:DUF4342 domain-containing protein [Clostridia bacterium]
MDHLEMVEKLREKANVSYEEANDALEACDWDLLDALLMLESEGRLHEMEEAAYSTRAKQPQKSTQTKARKAKGNGLLASLLKGAASLIKKGNAVSVQIKKNEEIRLSLPLTVVVIALIFMFWWMLIAVAVSMIFGYRYSIKGLSIDESVNNAMDKAGEFVDNVVKPCDVKIVVNHDDDESGPEKEEE